eukprot:scaffold1788_cov396-Prasinococcus_capsulatus_cf.AAC.8
MSRTLSAPVTRCTHAVTQLRGPLKDLDTARDVYAPRLVIGPLEEEGDADLNLGSSRCQPLGHRQALDVVNAKAYHRRVLALTLLQNGS